MTTPDTPVPATLHGRRLILVFAGGESDPPNGGLLVLDAAGGMELSRFPWRARRHESVNAAPPVVADGWVVISECYGMGTVALRMEASGEMRPLWTNRQIGVHFMQPPVQSDRLYAITGHGPGDNALVCLDLKTGRFLWRDPLRWTDVLPAPQRPRPAAVGVRLGWLVAAGGRVFCQGERGHWLWLDLGDDGVTVTSWCWLFPVAQAWAAPAIADGRLYVAQNAPCAITGDSPRLRCYRFRPPEAEARTATGGREEDQRCGNRRHRASGDAAGPRCAGDADLFSAVQ